MVIDAMLILLYDWFQLSDSSPRFEFVITGCCLIFLLAVDMDQTKEVKKRV